MKKTISIPYSDITITVHNKREGILAGVVTYSIESMIEDLKHNSRPSLFEQTCTHWQVEDTASKINAMYHLDMVSTPTSSVEVWNIIANTYNHSVTDHFLPCYGNCL